MCDAPPCSGVWLETFSTLVIWSVSLSFLSRSTMMSWFHYTHYGGFFGAQITNTLLIILIVTKADRMFGSYRVLMCVFALYSLLYSWIEVFTQPIYHIKGPVVIVAIDGPLRYEGWLTQDLPGLYAGSFAFCISLLASQFVYRYIALCSPKTLMTIERYFLLPLFIPCGLCFIIYYHSVHGGMAKTLESQEYLRTEFLEVYGEDTRKLSFIAQMYWSIGKHGEKIWKDSAFIAAVGCCSVIFACSATILFCAINIFWAMQEAQLHMSETTLEMNRQLVITLTFQTILPFIMMYIPIGCCILFPLFEIPAGKLANIAGVSLAIYPSLEPIVAIFCIRAFRRTLFCCCKKRKIGASNTQSLDMFTVHNATDTN